MNHGRPTQRATSDASDLSALRDAATHLVSAVERFLDALDASGADRRQLRIGPPPCGGHWSRTMAVGQAAAIIGISEDGLRSRIRARDPKRTGYVLFDGIEARHCGRNWRVRVDRRWLTDPVIT